MIIKTILSMRARLLLEFCKHQEGRARSIFVGKITQMMVRYIPQKMRELYVVSSNLSTTCMKR
jgi:hypothetical protein